ncbi:MAG: DUF72 domain-containing protein [Ignavibacteriaceae bacterium]
MAEIRFGTCSWKYDSWKNIIYPAKSEFNYLKEYSRHFDTVEIDQWFWSLFPPGKVVLPAENVVKEYNDSVPDDFLFTIKVPNSITLTHYYNRNKKEPLKKNPYFLSTDLFLDFIKTLRHLKKKIAVLIFQFEYLNKQKMPSQNEFQNRMKEFFDHLPDNLPAIGVETRNPNYLNSSYFDFLNSLKLYHVFLEGYYMPPATEIYKKYSEYINKLSVIRLHGPDRSGIEKISNGEWDKIYIDRSEELSGIAEMINNLQKRNVDLFVNVNNHFEGSAPLTIERIKKLLQS